LGLELQILEVRRREDVAEAIRAASNTGAEALNIFSSPLLASLHQEIIGFAARHRLPAIYQWREHVDAGGLMSYGPGLAAMFRQAAGIVVKILKGAKPANLPVEQPTKLELAVNARTAQALGLALPPSILLRADAVIE
jgi:putative ABC transport system substrate-binding protein